MLPLPRLLLFFFASALLCLPSLGPLSAQSTPYPREHWEEASPEAMGLERDALDKLAAYMEGDGCVIRHGRMVYRWGDPTRRGDVASACKPWISFFLFLALEEGLLEGLDMPAHHYKPCLAEINAELGYKDRGILMRHFATQTSCYGVRETPGTAFDYNDWQTALFVEILFQQIYKVPPDGYDGHILLPRLTEKLQCEDSPTFYAFGPQDRPGRLAVSPRDFCRFGYLFL
ncbi:MAG TPA: serine hydrolase, partial [Candidatus Hydrogenedentes bacterium]|nr:serine hydrolase [Candidatus Hydrogenedentota bacterium]